MRRQFLKNKGAVVGGVLLLLIVAIALLAPIVAPYDPLEMFPEQRLTAPSRQFLFGTDHYGRDMLSRIIYGAQISLQVGFIANLFAVILGMFVGVSAGFYGGRYDMIMMRFMDMIFA